MRSIKRFLVWWSSELFAMLPVAIIRAVTASTALIIEESTDGTFIVSRRVEHNEVCLICTAPGADVGHDLAPILSKKNGGEAIVIRVPEKFVIRFQINLPLAAERKLQTVAVHEIERHVPYPLNEVVWEPQVILRDTTARRLIVNITAVPREFFRRSSTLLQHYGQYATSIEATTPAGYIMIWGECNRIEKRLMSSLSKTALWVSALATLSLTNILIAQAHRIKSVKIEIQELDPKVSAIQADETLLRNRILYSRLQRHHIARDPVHILELVTNILPDDAYITQITISGPDIEIVGAANSASDLLLHINERLSFAQSRFISTVNYDASIKKERYDIHLQLEGDGS